MGNRCYFLGILYAGPQHRLPNGEQIPNNLGLAIHSYLLDDFIPMVEEQAIKNDWIKVNHN
jgi:hypothetical protein